MYDSDDYEDNESEENDEENEETEETEETEENETQASGSSRIRSSGAKKGESKKTKKKGKAKQDTNENNNNNSNNNSDKVTFIQRYTGHANVRTIKEVNFFGPRSEFIVSGSDCGRIFIWDKKAAKLVNVMVGDEDVVNCASGHPFDPVLATSGIESNVKIWSPKAEKSADLAGVDRITNENQANYGRPTRNISASVIHALVRAMAGHEDDEDDGDIGGIRLGAGADDDDEEDEGEEGGRRVQCAYQ